MMRQTLLATALGLGAFFGLAACATGPEAPTLSGADCPNPGQGGYAFWMEPQSREPGDKLALSPILVERPGMIEPLTPGCVAIDSIDPEDAATLSRDDGGLAILTIAEDAAAGTRIRVRGNYAGHGRLSGIIDVYVAEESPLVGYWRQDADACPAGNDIGEVVFGGDGEFSVTWRPFEVYKDYWGAYAYDVETGRLELSPESGNYIPDDVASGEIELSEDSFTLTTASFGTRRDGMAACAAPFLRTR